MSTTLLGPGQAPAEILEALRAIDPEADLVHLGDRHWWLGVRAPNPAAVQDLEGAYEAMRAVPEIEDPAERAIVAMRLDREFLMRQIMAQGFKPIALYECDGAPGMDIVEDFRIRDFNWRHQTEDQVKRELRDSVSSEKRNESKVRAWGQMAKDAAAEAYRFVFRGKRSVTRRAHNWR